jgi:hypothetical protein
MIRFQRVFTHPLPTNGPRVMISGSQEVQLEFPVSGQIDMNRLIWRSESSSQQKPRKLRTLRLEETSLPFQRVVKLQKKY